MTPEQLHLRDEVLQVLYWLKGEGLGDEATLQQLALWTGQPADHLQVVVDRLLGDRWLESGGSAATYRFTPEGEVEGKRRFADAFVDHGLGWGGPGSCGPDCDDCLIHGPENCHVHSGDHGHDHGNDHGHDLDHGLDHGHDHA